MRPPPIFPAATPNADEAALRLACIDAWADLFLAHPRHWSPTEGLTPEGCPDTRTGDEAKYLYVEGMRKAGQKRAAAPPIDDGASLTASERGQP